MKLSLMQAVDYWIGIPLCWIVSCFLRILRLVSPPAEGGPRKLLCIELSEMGSTILAAPALAATVRRLGRDHVYFMIFARNREGIGVLRLIPEQNVIEVDDSSLIAFAVSTLRAILTCRRLGVDTAVDLEVFSRCTALLTVLVGARIRVGLSTFCDEGLYRGDLLTHPVLYSPHHHMSRTYAALLEAPFASSEERPLLKQVVEMEWARVPRYNPTGKVDADLVAALDSIPAGRRMVVLNPDPGLLPLRGWPLEYFTELAKQISVQYADTVIAVTGVPRARTMADAILRNVPKDRAVDLCGKTKSLEELLFVLSKAAVLVTIDSGPAHLASLTDVATVVLFGPETPDLYRPMGDKVTVLYRGLSCSPCFSAANHRTSTCQDNQCLKQIPVSEAVAAVAATLGHPQS